MDKRQIEIPPFLSHLPVDPRGYPIPYFVPFTDGKPNFKYTDPEKQHQCFKNKQCGICGKKLLKNQFWFVGGPLSLKNKVSSDVHNHEQCARYALKVCPYLFNQKADRIATEGHNDIIVLEKPELVNLIFADRCSFIKYMGQHIYTFRPVRAYEFIYVNKVLTDTGNVIKVGL